ncbi:MAG: glycosyltransferase [Acetatifactor sp.]|nr:glycosyltransferase [Acetatifactor sp.]
MRKINGSDIKKTIYYLKRNGIRNTISAALERVKTMEEDYLPIQLTSGQLEEQRKGVQGFQELFSIVVPAYRTNPVYLKELIDSLLAQTYSDWELILADATEDESVKTIVETYEDSRICYVHLECNGGISENTNAALSYVKGQYTGLLDHDDLLTADALYEMAKKIAECKAKGIEVSAVYSDEDKCDQDAQKFYEPNYKEDFNFDMLLSNNYICHFLVMKTEVMRKLRFRKEYDGAQDYDLVLRAAYDWMEHPERIAHVPKVLYHWRCHNASTAENPQSKQYAYEAGRRALQNFADTLGFHAEARHLKHLGFYELKYTDVPFDTRSDLAAVGGRIISGNRVAGGRYGADGTLFYEGLPAAYSGYLHRAVLQQDAEALDMRCIKIAPEYQKVFEKITGVMYCEDGDTGFFDISRLPVDTDWKALSIQLGEEIRKQGGRMLYMPSVERKWKHA